MNDLCDHHYPGGAKCNVPRSRHDRIDEAGTHKFVEKSWFDRAAAEAEVAKLEAEEARLLKFYEALRDTVDIVSSERAAIESRRLRIQAVLAQ